MCSNDISDKDTNHGYVIASAGILNALEPVLSPTDRNVGLFSDISLKLKISSPVQICDQLQIHVIINKSLPKKPPYYFYIYPVDSL